MAWFTLSSKSRMLLPIESSFSRSNVKLPASAYSSSKETSPDISDCETLNAPSSRSLNSRVKMVRCSIRFARIAAISFGVSSGLRGFLGGSGTDFGAGLATTGLATTGFATGAGFAIGTGDFGAEAFAGFLETTAFGAGRPAGLAGGFAGAFLTGLLFGAGGFARTVLGGAFFTRFGGGVTAPARERRAGFRHHLRRGGVLVAPTL